MGDSHGHIQSAAGRNKKSLAIVFGLTAFYLIVEIIGGFWTGSLALLADAGHMLTDVAGVGLALLAIWFAEKPASPERTLRLLSCRNSRGFNQCRCVDFDFALYFV